MPLFELPSTRRKRRERAIRDALRAAPLGMFAPELARVVGVSLPGIYVRLSRMEYGGRVVSWWVESEDSAKPRRRKYGVVRPESRARS